MALFNHATKEVTAKLVYYGPGLCGKTSNLQWIHDKLNFKAKGKLVSLATQTDRTLFFDFLPLELGTIRGMRTRMQIYTVPGQVFYEATRRMVLKGCDAVVFVADSQAAMLDANAESQLSLRNNLLLNELDPELPQVIQYNKRDLPTALPVSVLDERLNPRGLPCYEAVAFRGTGVEQTLKGVTKLLFQRLSRVYGEGAADAAPAAAKVAEPEAPKHETARVTIHAPDATLAGEPSPAVGTAAPITDEAALRPASPTPPPASAPQPTERPTAPAAVSRGDETDPAIRSTQQPQPPTARPDPQAARTSAAPHAVSPASPSSPLSTSRLTVPPGVSPVTPVATRVQPPSLQPVVALPLQPVPAPPLQPVVVVPPQPVVHPTPQPVLAPPPPQPVVASPPQPVVPQPPQPVLAPPPPAPAPPRAAAPPSTPADAPAPVAPRSATPSLTGPPAPRAVAPPAGAPTAAPAPPRPPEPSVASARPAPVEPPQPPVTATPPAGPAGPSLRPVEEVPAATLKAGPSQPSPTRPAPAEVPLRIEKEEEAPPATTVSASHAKQPAPVPDASEQLVEVDAPAAHPPARPVAPAPVAAAAPPAPGVEPAKPQPSVMPGAARRPAAASLPRRTSAPAPQPAAGPRTTAPEAKPARPADPAPQGEGLRADQWLYLLDGSQRGPIDVEDLIDLVLTSIPESTKVWHPGFASWVMANQVREIADEIPPPIPVPGLTRAVYGDEEMPDFNTVPRMLRSVLIADEDAAFRKYLAMPLAAQGFTIYEAADGSAAWQLAVQNRPWLILADVSMPELDGFEFCRRVRTHPMLQRMPLLFISGSDKYKERYRALQIGADDFLSKNMPVRELLMRIQLLMTRYSDLSASEPKAGAEDVAAGAFQGRIEVFGAPALLQMCAQGRLTGLFTSVAEDALKTATVIGFREGDVISATAGDITGTEGVYAFLAWTRGSFKFTPGDPGDGEPLAPSVEHLLLEGCRLLDESQKGGAEGGASFP